MTFNPVKRSQLQLRTQIGKYMYYFLPLFHPHPFLPYSFNLFIGFVFIFLTILRLHQSTISFIRLQTTWSAKEGVATPERNKEKGKRTKGTIVKNSSDDFDLDSITKLLGKLVFISLNIDVFFPFQNPSILNQRSKITKALGKVDNAFLFLFNCIQNWHGLLLILYFIIYIIMYMYYEY